MRRLRIRRIDAIAFATAAATLIAAPQYSSAADASAGAAPDSATAPAPIPTGGAGTVAIIEGNAYAQKGAIYYTHPIPGQSVKVNQFGQYRDKYPDAPAFVKWEQNTRRHLKANDIIEEGDVIQTMGDAWVKILFNDDSLLDIGPAAMVQLEKFQGTGKDRNVLFKVLYGKVRGIVAQPLSGPQHYVFLTPTAQMGVRGAEFLVNVFPDTAHRQQTEIVCVHGQISIDVNKFDTKGVVYTQPMVANPGTIFATSGVNGLGMTTSLTPVPQSKLRSIVAEVSPAVDTRATIVGVNPPPSRLPGTGIRLDWDAANAPKIAKHDPQINSFDMDHPPVQRMIASSSGNFEIPHDFEEDSAGFGHLRDTRNFTGAPPVQFLPATTSHVTINLVGLP